MDRKKSDLTRRDFLKKSSAATVGALGTLSLASSVPSALADSRSRLAVVGTGARGIGMWSSPVVRDYPNHIKMVGLCDINPKRVEVAQKMIIRNVSDMDGQISTRQGKAFAGQDIPTFTDFDEMVKAVKPDRVIVTTMDSVHAKYVIRAMELGCDVICEKPFTTDEEQCQAIIDAEKKHKKNVTVTFNARYGQSTVKVKELIREGAIGRLLSVDYAEYLDLDHGTSYFRRWHGLKECSGTLLVHKASHHFDQLNWWIDSDPVEVNAYGSLEKYGRKGPFRHANCRMCTHKNKCAFYWDITKDERLMDLYVNCESEDGYFRDGCVYRNAINIYDTMSVQVKYENDVLVTYSLNAGVPLEGQIVVFNGTEGRIEVRNFKRQPWNVEHPAEVRLMRNFAKDSELIPITRRKGTHGGSDTLIRDHIFIPEKPDELGFRAGTRAGIMSSIIGIAAYRSIEASRKYRIDEMIDIS